MIISVNAEKAFYKIQHPFMTDLKKNKKNPDKLGIKGELFNLIRGPL